MTYSSPLDTLKTRGSICMLVTSDLAYDRRVQKEARLASEAGYDVTVICRSFTGKLTGYHVVPIGVNRRSTRLAKYLERIVLNLRMIQAALSIRPAIVHANDLDTLPAAYFISKISGAKLLYDSHELWPDVAEGLSRVGQAIAGFVQRFIVRRADAVVTVNEFLAERIFQRTGGPYPQVVMNVPWYVCSSDIVPGEWLQQFQKKKVVLYQGIYAAGRGLPEAITAAHGFPQDAALVLRGLGPFESTISESIREQRVSDRVTMVPPVPADQMVVSAAGADIGLVLVDPIHASYLYSGPNKLFEYIMAGVPCIGSDLPFIRKIIHHFGVGEVCRPGDPDDLARVIRDILETPGKLDAMKQRCREAARQLSWDIEGQKLIGEYERILTTGHKRASEVPANQVAA